MGAVSHPGRFPITMFRRFSETVWTAGEEQAPTSFEWEQLTLIFLSTYIWGMIDTSHPPSGRNGQKKKPEGLTASGFFFVG